MFLTNTLDPAGFHDPLWSTPWNLDLSPRGGSPASPPGSGIQNSAPGFPGRSLLETESSGLRLWLSTQDVALRLRKVRVTRKIHPPCDAGRPKDLTNCTIREARQGFRGIGLGNGGGTSSSIRKLRFALLFLLTVCVACVDYVSIRAEEAPEAGGAEAADAESLEVAAIDPTQRRTAAAAARIPLLLGTLAKVPESVVNPVTVPPRRYSGIAVNAIPLPQSTEDYVVEKRRLVDPLRDLYDIPMEEPDFLGQAAEDIESTRGVVERELSQAPQTPELKRALAIQRLVEKLAFRKLRKEARSTLRERFEDDPSYDIYLYREERAEISRLDPSNPNHDDYDFEEVRAAVLEGDDDGEKDITLFHWGPLSVNDSGDVKLDLAELKSQRVIPREIELATEEAEDLAAEPFFEGKSFKLNTDVRFRPRVHKLLENESFSEVIGKTGVTFEVDFFSDVLRRRYMKAELESTLRPDGETGVFFNLVIYGN